ncbi:hypothetical protein J7649_10010 [Acinetobacter lwoffii]|uniref:hypothetical protein n=1 Tax=Acinetobacter lwoffii TaxID=28090 RepID=UPI001C5A81B2|nr:hypothetical protein [Acinetobacter lwoffii]QXX85728.1 hypothetical protein J7649_10010 [Acinetobacter lwoffii]
MEIKLSNFLLVKAVVFLSILLFPIYFLPSGGVQISSFFFILLFCISLYMTDRNTYNLFFRVTYPFYFFLIYALFLNLVWFFILLNPGIFFSYLFLIFNFLILYSFSLVLYKNDELFKSFPVYLIISLLVQVFVSFLLNSDSARSSLLFNNPNQLGYFALISASILVFYYKIKLLNIYFFILGIFCCLWLVQLSLSSAAIFSILLLIFYVLCTNIRSLIFLFIIFLILILIFYINDYSLNDERLYVVLEKLGSTGEASDDSLGGRGYDRIINHPEIILTGGGEGVFDRWNSILSESEIHSTWGTLLFSYGIFGLISFLWFLRKIVFAEYLISFIPFLSIALYGLTHNGLRFSFFWIFLAVIISHSLRKLRF